jgi:hypothetical protein
MSKYAVLVSISFLCACSSNDGGGVNADAGAAAESGPTNPSEPSAPGAFGAQCSDDAECTEKICVFSTTRGGKGFCSKQCDAVAECPAQYDCAFIGGAARKTCIPEDRRKACEDRCSDLSFFECIDKGKLQTCVEACSTASVEVRKRFLSCSDKILECETSCLDGLAPGKGPWSTPKDPCTRDDDFDMQCQSMRELAKGYTCEPGKEPTQPGCASLPLPGVHCCP